MLRMRSICAAVLCAAIPLGAQTLDKRIQALLSASPLAERSFWGISIADAATGAPVFRWNDRKSFVPASNNKLFTSALALTKLGPGYRFETRVTAPSLPDSEGRIAGDVFLVGGGDPNLSGRVVPYQRNALTGQPLAAIASLAEQIVARGVRVVDGDIVGDDTAYDWDPYPDGWSADDTVWDYGAPVSALALTDSVLRVTLEPGAEPGTPGVISVHPPLEALVIHNRTRTVEGEPQEPVSFRRLPGSRELLVSGEVRIGSAPDATRLSIADPAEYAAMALLAALRERGVRISGQPRTVHRRKGEATTAPLPVELARHTSAPLLDALQIVNKVSQNLHTEMVLLELARQATGTGSRKAALEQIDSFMAQLGVPPEDHRFEDGSGLSRLNLVAPDTFVKLLVFMYASKHRDAWLSLFPVGGFDGTLAGRFGNAPAAVRIKAKTGSLSHVSALTGYALRVRGRPYAFSIIVNNANAPNSELRSLIDKIALAILRE